MADSLNDWIREVESHLTDLTAVERAAAMAELNNQLRRSMGDPAQVAKSIRLQLGIGESRSIVRESYQSAINSGPVGSSARRFFKYATFAILGLVVLFMASIFLVPLMIFKFIAVDNFEKDISFSFTEHKPQMERVHGKLAGNPLTRLTITLTNGQVVTTTDPHATEITYDCEVESQHAINQTEVARVDSSGATLALLNVETADCDVVLPSKIPFSVNVTSGRIALSQVEQNVEANLTNGEIEFEASPKAIFNISATALKGSVEGLKSKKNKEPQYSAALSVGNGRIDIE